MEVFECVYVNSTWEPVCVRIREESLILGKWMHEKKKKTYVSHIMLALCAVSTKKDMMCPSCYAVIYFKFFEKWGPRTATWTLV